MMVAIAKLLFILLISFRIDSPLFLKEEDSWESWLKKYKPLKSCKKTLLRLEQTLFEFSIMRGSTFSLSNQTTNEKNGEGAYKQLHTLLNTIMRKMMNTQKESKQKEELIPYVDLMTMTIEKYAITFAKIIGQLKMAHKQNFKITNELLDEYRLLMISLNKELDDILKMKLDYEQIIAEKILSEWKEDMEFEKEFLNTRK